MPLAISISISRRCAYLKNIMPSSPSLQRVMVLYSLISCIFCYIFIAVQSADQFHVEVVIGLYIGANRKYGYTKSFFLDRGVHSKIKLVASQLIGAEQ